MTAPETVLKPAAVQVATRRRLPRTRKALTHTFHIKGAETEHQGYLTVGFYDDGTVGEIFVKMDRQGSQVSGFVDAWSISVSMLLQMGMPLADICNKFRGLAFQPAGQTDNEHIHFAKSPIDYIARWLEMKYVDPEMAS